MMKKKTGFGLMAAFALSMLVSVTSFAAGGFKDVGGNRFYYQEDGTMQKGWLTLEGKQYYFAPKTGVMYTGIRKIGGITYVFGEDGVLQKVCQEAGFRKTANGKIWYSYGDGTKRPKNQWLKINGKTYYFNKKGYVLTGWKKVEGYTYCFSNKGVMQTSKWVKYKGKNLYLGADGRIAKDTWIGDKYVGSDGNYIAGYRDDRRTNSSGTGWVGYGKQWKYYSKNKMVTGWKTIGGKRYYFDSDGFMHTGWLKVKNRYYFMDTRTVALGQMITGWCKISNKYYYFFRSKTKANNTTYPKGSMAQGISIRFTLTNGDQKIYVFDKNGVCTNY
ncbi:MAG: hypothetical protein PUD04_09365 [Firmicutes bacterium]|nr:hypothetical protein [Lachnospiraceae bacterium]MDD6066752.1 hypothetical protein [Bacillota bacterium]MDY2819872.1 hypothetical protein [Hominisplanchenecus sp.]